MYICSFSFSYIYMSYMYDIFDLIIQFIIIILLYNIYNIFLPPAAGGPPGALRGSEYRGGSLRSPPEYRIH